MKKRIFAIVLTLSLVLSMSAFAADSRVESLEYKGFGILKLEFNHDTNWYPAAEFTLSDGFTSLTVTAFAGEEDDAYLYAPEIIDGGDYSLGFTLGNTVQTIPFTADPSIEVKINKNGELKTKVDKDRCDFCDVSGHDEDFCPERVNPGDIPADLGGMAWYFDIDEFCERCGGIGHDDDDCLNR